MCIFKESVHSKLKTINLDSATLDSVTAIKKFTDKISLKVVFMSINREVVWYEVKWGFINTTIKILFIHG